MKVKLIPLIPLVLCLSAFGASLSNHRHLATTGHGMIKAEPDLAVVSLTVSAARKTSLKAKRVVDARVNQFLKRLHELRIRRADISASELVTRPEYKTETHRRVLQDWLARRPLSITLRDLGRLNKLMNSALKAGVEQVDNIQLKVSDEEHYKHQALARAIKDSKATARALSKAYGAALGPIYSIDYDNGAPIQPVTRAASFAKQATQPGNYLQQKITFKQTIQVVFDLRISR